MQLGLGPQLLASWRLNQYIQQFTDRLVSTAAFAQLGTELDVIAVAPTLSPS
jgi:hypothetical protein